MGRRAVSVILPIMPRESKLPKHLQPMLATLIDAPFDGREWVFESKWDGFRIVGAIKKRSVTLYSCNGLIVSDNFMPITKALEKIKDAVIDGELVEIDAHGISVSSCCKMRCAATRGAGDADGNAANHCTIDSRSTNNGNQQNIHRGVMVSRGAV